MNTSYKRTTLTLLALLGTCAAQASLAAVSLDRTRVIFTGGEKSVSLSISNQNTQLPYLAQAWIENEQAEKITSPLVVVPPIQRLEAGANSQVKIQGLPELAGLPQDRESLFYFNLARSHHAATNPIRCKSPCRRGSSCSIDLRRSRRGRVSTKLPGRNN